MNMFVQVFVILAVSLSAHGDLVVNRCGDGSSYWCKNFNTAKQCGKISECKKTVWASPMQNSEVCDICKDAVEALAGYIGNNRTKQMVEGALKKLCSDVPIKELSDECTQIVTKDFDLLYDEFVDLIENGDLVCGALGLCSASAESLHVDMLMKKLRVQLKNALNNHQLPVASVHLVGDTASTKNDGCSDCQAFLEDVRKVMKSDKNLIGEWNELARMECNALGPRLNLVCQDHMEEAITALVNDMNGNDDMVKICRRINMCHFKSHKTEGNDMCADCKNFFEDWKTLIMKNNSVVKEIVKEVAEFYCLQKPRFLRKKCSRYVAMAIKIALNRVMQKSPDEICEAIDFCSAPELLKENQMKKLIQQKSMTANGDHCTDCTTFLTDLQSIARSSKSIVDDLTDMLEAQCDQLGFVLSGLCSKQVPVVVTNFLPQFETADVGALCTTILMCNSPPVKPATGGDVCPDCIAFAQDWQTTFVHNETFVDNLLDKAAIAYCNQLPFFQDKCDDVAKNLVKNLLDYVEATEASTVCTKVKLCSATSGRKLLSDAFRSKPVQVQKKGAVVGFTKEPKKTSMTANGDHCTDCTTFLTDLQSIARNNRSIADDLTDMLEAQCDQLGFVLSGLCRKQVPVVVTNFLPQFETADVGALCTTILMCNSPPVKPAEGGDVCPDCIAFAQDWHTTLVYNETFVDNLLDKAALAYCNQLPFFQDKCDDVAKNLVKNLLDYVKDTEASSICTKVKLCGAPSDRNLLLSDAFRSKPVEVQKKGAVVGFTKEPKKTSMTANGDHCTDCTTFLTDLQSIARSNKSIVDDLTDMLEAQCDQLGFILSGLCRKQVPVVVTNFLPQFETADVGALCTTILMCNSPPVKPATGGDVCPDCIAFAQDWQITLVHNETFVDNLLDKAALAYCNQLPFFQDKCDDVAKNLIKKLLDYVKDTEASVICTKVKLCGAPSDRNLLLSDAFRSKPVEVQKKAVVGFTKEPKKIKDPVTCVLCRIIVHELDKMLEGNRTEVAVQKALDEVCSVLPKEMSNDCTSFINTYGKDIIDLLIDEVESGVICSRLMLCAVESRAPSKEVTPCELCTVLMTQVDTMVQTNVSMDVIIGKLDEMCVVVPSVFKQNCKDTIKNVVQSLKQGEKPKRVCADYHFCPHQLRSINPAIMRMLSNVMHDVLRQKSEQDGVGCTLCMYAFTELENVLKAYNVTKEEVVNDLDLVCSFLPGQYKKKCTDAVSVIGSIVQALSHGAAPRDLCATFSICPSKTISLDPTTKCDLCVVVGEELDHLLTKNSTEEDIVHALDKVCSILPSYLARDCKALIEDFGEKIISALVNGIKPELLCSSIGLCRSKPQMQQKSSALCTICTIVVTELDALLKENRTEAEIIHAVEKVCDVLPPVYKDRCDSFIDSYGSTIITLLIGLVPPKEICGVLHLCPLQKKVTGMGLCLICEAITGELDQKLSDKPTQKEIENALEKVCHLVTGKLRDECDDFIKINAPAILDLLARDFAPLTICPELHMCPKKKVVKSTDSTLCDICHAAIEFLDKELETNATRADIERALDNLCDKLPAEFKDSCDNLVEEYTPEILDLADHIFDPDYVCIHLKICEMIQKPSLVGGNPCTYGPSYWCKNERTAKECHAMDHCRLHVWN